jgi:ppGpp synthetase/RelA/SpoT-type nucleotidyltranferase
MDLEQKPTWSKGELNRLGEALIIDKAATPDGCPQYAEVMRWHNDLAAEVAARIASTPWVTIPLDQLSISARPKTVDTLVQKLQRQPTLKLGQVQDLAGVRIDADLTLTQQTTLAQEIAEQFGAPAKAIKDIREKPHSGYRAVHVCLALPPGRAEVQIRTLLQSEWANAYEGLGELVGRGIRYKEKHENAKVQHLVESMQTMADGLAQVEALSDTYWRLKSGIEALSPTTAQQAEVLEKATRTYEELNIAERYATIKAGIDNVLNDLRGLHRKIKETTEGV